MATKAELIQKIQSDYEKVSEVKHLGSDENFPLTQYRVQVMSIKKGDIRQYTLNFVVENEGLQNEKAYLLSDPKKDIQITTAVSNKIADKETDGTFVKGRIENVNDEKSFATVSARVKENDKVFLKKYLVYDKNGWQFDEIDQTSFT